MLLADSNCTHWRHPCQGLLAFSRMLIHRASMSQRHPAYWYGGARFMLFSSIETIFLGLFCDHGLDFREMSYARTSSSLRIGSHPRIRHLSIYLQLQQTGDDKSGPLGRYRPARCGNPNLGFLEPAQIGEDKVPSPDQNTCIYLRIQQAEDESGGPPGRYRLAQCRNPNLGFVQSAPAGDYMAPSPDQKSFHISTTPTNRQLKR